MRTERTAATARLAERAQDNVRRIWNRDMAHSEAALAPFVMEIDGELFLTADAPAELAGIYGRLSSVGYARGFIA